MVGLKEEILKKRVEGEREVTKKLKKKSHPAFLCFSFLYACIVSTYFISMFLLFLYDCVFYSI
jgi:hypothetical protein